MGIKSKVRILGFGLMFLLPIALQAQLVDKTPAAVPVAPTIFNAEPWENPQVDGINRDQSRTTAYSFTSVKDALTLDRDKSTRTMSLNGLWDFSFAEKPSDAPTD